MGNHEVPATIEMTFNLITTYNAFSRLLFRSLNSN
jgi:hypothetical protein